MKYRRAFFPGSFDPFTYGHLDIAIRAAKMFETVHIVVVHNPAKKPRFTASQRVQMITEVLAGKPGNFVVNSFESGLLVDYCKTVNADALVKGVK